MKLEAYKDIKQHIVSTTGTESQMTVKCLKDVSTVLAIVFALIEGGLKRHFSIEREIMKLMFAFDHINDTGCITYQYIYINNLLRKDNSIVKDLITSGHGASCSGTRTVQSMETL